MRMFPIQTSHEHAVPDQLKSIPWDMIAPHEAQALRNHCDQNLERLAQRCGLSACEAVAVLENKDYRTRWPDIYGRGGSPEHVREADAALKKIVEERKIS